MVDKNKKKEDENIFDKNIKNEENIKDEDYINEEDKDFSEGLEESFKEEEAEIEVEEEKEKGDDKLQNLTDKFMRLQADFVNFRRRTEKEKAQYVDLGITKLANSILPVIDNFERSMDAQTDHDGFFEGICLIKDQLIDALKANNIVEMDAKGKKFDPNFHHAVMTEKSEEYDEGIVTEVFQKGYLINDKVLRPAMVKVSE